MKTFLTAILIFICWGWTVAQSLSFSQVNSKNVLDFYYKQQLPQTGRSMDVTIQQGNQNVIVATDVSPSYLQLIQSGNYNTTLFNNQNNYPTNAQIHINGSNNYIDIVGSNSISNGMIMNINANDMTIFMRNY